MSKGGRTMKTNRIFMAAIFFGMTLAAGAQEVSTLYFLENAPMRHIVNPALQPVSDGYVNFSPLGYTSMWSGNNSLTVSDIFQTDANGNTITMMHPNADKQKALNAMRKTILVDGQLTTNWLSFGFRLKNQKGYVHINIMEKIEYGMSVPKSFYEFALDGGMKDMNGINRYNLNSFGIQGDAYTEIAGGYSHKINDKWTVGGKVKLLLGTAYVNLNNNEFNIESSHQQMLIRQRGSLNVALPLGMQERLPDHMYYRDIKDAVTGGFEKVDVMKIIKPSGYGAALDLGMAYKPHPQVQITAALNDLGFITWTGGDKYQLALDTVYTGFDKNLNGIRNDGLMSDIGKDLVNALEAIEGADRQHVFTRMVSAKLNVGVDANFWQNRVGIGVLSRTRLFNNRLYEEVTFGAALRPCNWFNLAVSYSLLNNGKYSNIGAGLSFMPYDGINMTLAMDYIPTSYGAKATDGAYIPEKSKGMNLLLGFSIVWGTNRKDKDHDKVWDDVDMCLGTPRGVKVDKLGCPIDSDGDGVPDYLDKCPMTSEKAYGMVDTMGCAIDSDGDGVPDYLDECPNTPIEARGMVDEKGCPLDSDGDGVPDYLDECPFTPAEAIAAHATVDKKGCIDDGDEDGDGVPNWKDRCPHTPAQAQGHVDEFGCEIDTDGDKVPDWKDQCPDVPGPAYNSGCPEVKREVKNLLKKAMQGIQFETGKATIKKASYPLLDQIAATFIENPSFIVEVQGHTDNVGKAASNKKLSQKRAEAVRDYLVQKGVNADNFTAVGYGDEKPIADNSTAAGRKENRRVEFQITFEQTHIETVYEHADEELLKEHLAEEKAKEEAAAAAAEKAAEEEVKATGEVHGEIVK